MKKNVEQTNNDCQERNENGKLFILYIFYNLFDTFRIKTQNEEENHTIPAPELK